MIKSLSKLEVEEIIRNSFSKENFSTEEVKKIKKLAMKYRIRLGKYRERFCKGCLNKLSGRTRVSRKDKIIVCNKCGSINRFCIN